jgi:hypothetical protein
MITPQCQLGVSHATTVRPAEWPSKHYRKNGRQKCNKHDSANSWAVASSSAFGVVGGSTIETFAPPREPQTNGSYLLAVLFITSSRTRPNAMRRSSPGIVRGRSDTADVIAQDRYAAAVSLLAQALEDERANRAVAPLGYRARWFRNSCASLRPLTQSHLLIR